SFPGVASAKMRPSLRRATGGLVKSRAPATFVQGSSPSHSPSRSLSARPVSGGQVARTPSHSSATSHASDEDRHTSPAWAAGWMHRPAPLQMSIVQISPSSVHAVPPYEKQSSDASWHVSAHSPPPSHGSPACTVQAPAAQASAPLQKTPSSHGPVSRASCAHAPTPSQASAVQPLPSLLQDSPAGAGPHASIDSSQEVAHSGPLAHGGAPWRAHAPRESQASAPSQKRPSSHADPARSGRQVAEQQSPPVVLPSSHASPASRTPSPHRSVLEQTALQPSPETWLPSSHASPGSMIQLPQVALRQTNAGVSHSSSRLPDESAALTRRSTAPPSSQAPVSVAS